MRKTQIVKRNGRWVLCSPFNTATGEESKRARYNLSAMKKIAFLIIVVVYILAVITSLLLVIKPGAAIFYYKAALQMEHCAPDSGFAYRCPVNLSPKLFSPERVLLFEDGQQLYRGTRSQISTTGNGEFTVEVTANGDYSIYFAPIENSDPLSNDAIYRVYYAPIFFSRAKGIQYLGILLAGLLLYGLLPIFRSAFRRANNWLHLRLVRVKSSFQMVVRFLARKGAFFANIVSAANSGRRSFFLSWGKLYVVTGAAAYWLIFMEWLFLVTGASFMSGMSLGQKLEILLLSGLFLTCVALTLLTVLLALSLALRISHLSWIAFLIAELVSTALMTAMIVLMADNFTYVIFHFGILTAMGVGRTLYGILIGVVLIGVYWQRLKSWQPESWLNKSARGVRMLGGITLGLAAISLVTAFLRFDPSFTSSDLASQASAASRPNIILIGSDGLTAKNMSVYGYERDTTPNIKALGSTSLVAENAFSNSSATLGSIVSILTSKWSTQTGVIYPPNILQGEDAFEHLPGILSKAGYKTVEIGVPYYVDAYMVNVQDGFDVVNQRSMEKDPLVSAWRDAGYDLPAYFIYKLEEKLVNRLLHAFYLETIANPFSVVTQPTPELQDRQKMDQLLSLLGQTDAPIFVHVHLMGTHGARFAIDEGKYSLGQEQTQDWMVDFYDDAILAFDSYIGELVEYLKTTGQFDNTLLIIYSDHATKYYVRDRVPMIFHFPGDQYAATISDNTQNLDIAPTILDYMGQAVPNWMNGISLLSANPDNDRLIFSIKPISVTEVEAGKFSLDVNNLAPPFYQFQAIQVVVCNRWYELNLRTQEWIGWIVEQHTAPCAESDLPDEAAIRQSIIEFLDSQGYDVSTLR